jgi:hypothetical protein
VSPIWRDEVALFLAPRRIALTRIGRGLKPKSVKDAEIAVPDGNFSDWRPMIEALRSQLADEHWRDARARLVMSDHWARYVVVPWSDDLSTDEERTTHARACMANVYGEVVNQWRISESLAMPGLSRVACGIPEVLLADLKPLLQDAGLTLGSLQPQLIAAYNSWRHRLPDTQAWFVSIDEGVLAAARMLRGAWDRVYSARIGLNWAMELRRLQTFGRLAAEATEGAKVYVDAPQWLRDLAGQRDLGVEWLIDDGVDQQSGRSHLLRRMYA